MVKEGITAELGPLFTGMDGFPNCDIISPQSSPSEAPCGPFSGSL